MVKGMKDDVFVAFLDMEKAYDRVNRKKLFGVMRGYVVHDNSARLNEIISDGSIVKFELDKVTKGWCKCDSGVRHGCPLSSLPFNIYVRELGKVINNCEHGVKYAVVGKDGVMEWKSQAYLLTDDQKCGCLISIMWAATYKLLKNILHPTKPNERTFSENCKILSDYFSPNPIIIAERF